MRTFWTLTIENDSLRGGKTPSGQSLGEYKIRPLPRINDHVQYGECVWNVIDNKLVPKNKIEMWPDDARWMSKVINGVREFVAFRAEDLIVLFM